MPEKEAMGLQGDRVMQVVCSLISYSWVYSARGGDAGQGEWLSYAKSQFSLLEAPTLTCISLREQNKTANSTHKSLLP